MPPKALLKLASAFCQQIKDRLQKSDLTFAEAEFFASPRRIAVLIKDLVDAQPDQVIERKGPALSAAFDAKGNPTPACVGFARSCGVTAKELKTIKNHQGEWVGYEQAIAGKSVTELLPTIVEQALQALPIPKRMRWSDNEVEFVRPVHSVDLVIWRSSDRCRYFRLAKLAVLLMVIVLWRREKLKLLTLQDMQTVLSTTGYVIADFERTTKEN